MQEPPVQEASQIQPVPPPAQSQSPGLHIPIPIGSQV